jgi:hypothetical protein
MTAHSGNQDPPRHAMLCTPTLEGEVIRTSGFCWICDTWFNNKWALHYRARAAPGGWALCECRHLREHGILPPSAPAAAALGDRGDTT